MKNKKGKTRMTLCLPRFKEAVARARQKGMEDSGYSSNSWQEVNDEDFLDAALRHVNAYEKGELLDTTGEHHLAHAASNLGFIIERFEQAKEDLNRQRKKVTCKVLTED